MKFISIDVVLAVDMGVGGISIWESEPGLRGLGAMFHLFAFLQLLTCRWIVNICFHRRADIVVLPP